MLSPIQTIIAILLLLRNIFIEKHIYILYDIDMLILIMTHRFDLFQLTVLY